MARGRGKGTGPEPTNGEDEPGQAVDVGRPLVERARGGDLRAFEQLYRMHVGRTHALALRMVGDPAEAEEVTQDVWVRAWERLESFRGDSTFTTWLHRLTVNQALDHLRSRKRRHDRSHSLEHPGARARATAPTPTEDRMELERALAGLPDGARTVFVLHEVEGLKCREVAEATGVAVGTVKAQLHRARSLLRDRVTR